MCVRSRVGADFDAGAAVADEIGQQVPRCGAEAGLEADAALVGLAGDDARIVAVAGAGGEQIAGVVGDGDTVGRQAFDGGRDEMLDGADFLGGELAADRDDDRGRRVLLVAREQRALRQDEVDAGRLDAASDEMVRASSPSSARTLLMFWTKLVAPSVFCWSKIS